MKDKRVLNVVECSGTPYEIGKQYGTACRESIRKSAENLLRGICYMQKTSMDEVLAVTKKYLPLVERFDPEMIKTLKGQADGAGIPFEQVFAVRCGTEMNFYFQRLTTLCSSFAVTGKATKNGKTIVGQTYDWSPGSTLDLVKTRHRDGLEQLSLVISAGVGGEVLLNSAGLSMALNVMVGPPSQQLLNIPFACLIPKAMRQKRIGDALGMVCASGRSILNYIFGSAEGDIIGIETWPDDYNVMYPERDMLVHTNHYLTERFKGGAGNMGFMEGDSHIRLQRLKKLFNENYGELTPEMLMGFMADHNDYPRSICKHVDDGVALGETIAAIIMVPAEQTMYVTIGHPCQNEFSKYEL